MQWLIDPTSTTAVLVLKDMTNRISWDFEQDHEVYHFVMLQEGHKRYQT